MKLTPLALASAAALALAGGAVYAQTPANSPAVHGRGADTTRAQAEQRSAAAFARMDANHDGVLDAADREARKAARGEQRAARQQARFERLDTNDDGSISRAEFDAPRALVGRGQDGKRAGPRGHRGPRMGGFGGRAAFNAGGDQSVTQAEFTAAALDRFDSADANNDGTLTAAERRAAFKALRQQRSAPAAATPS